MAGKLIGVQPNYWGPGYTSVEDAKRNPYDIKTWGAECGRGFRTFKDAGGTHITSGARKSHRGMASDGLKEKQ